MNRAAWTEFAVHREVPEAKPRKRRSNVEHYEQVAVVGWANSMSGSIPELRLLFAIPNAGGYSGGFKSNVGRAKKLISEGVKSGVPDLFLPVACGNYHGMFIEMKATNGRIDPVQHEWAKALQQQGFYTCFCFGACEAIERIQQYILQQPTPER